MERLVEERLAEKGARYTNGRRAVLIELSRAEGPMAAAEVHERLAGEVPLSSVYRSLAVLEECGVLAPHHGARGLTRYELAEWLSGHHHHLVCIECGSVDDIALSARQEQELEGLIEGVTSSAAFRIRGHSLEIDGRCARCA